MALARRSPFRSPGRTAAISPISNTIGGNTSAAHADCPGRSRCNSCCLEAADQALQDAGYDEKPFDRTRVGVVVGTEFGGDFAFQLQMALRLPEMERNRWHDPTRPRRRRRRFAGHIERSSRERLIQPLAGADRRKRQLQHQFAGFPDQQDVAT